MSLVSSRTHRWLIYCERRIGSSMARWHRQRVPNWIASGVILTCSVTVKSQMFWFILSPLSIRSLLFSAMEGFSTEGLAKAGSVYTVHSGRKWRRDKNLLTHGIPTSKIHSRACAHLFSRVHAYSSIAQICAPATCFRNDSLLWLNIFSFAVAWLKQQRKQTLMHKASPLTHLSCRGSDGAHFFSFYARAVLLQLPLWCWDFFFFFFSMHLSPRTMGRSSERPYRVCQFEVPLCSRTWGRGAASTAPTHGAQTKQQDECFLNPTWQGGTPICPFWLDRLTEWINRREYQTSHRRGAREDTRKKFAVLTFQLSTMKMVLQW